MKSALEGELDLEEALPYIDRCLGCLGCVTACPSGVPYGEMLMPFREYAEEGRRRPLFDRAARALVQETIPYPARFRLAAQAGKMAKPFKKALPGQFQGMLQMLPEEHLPSKHALPAFYPASLRPVYLWLQSLLFAHVIPLWDHVGPEQALWIK